jgi:hypothetical protein
MLRVLKLPDVVPVASVASTAGRQSPRRAISRVRPVASAADQDGLRGMARRLAAYGEPVRRAIESMNGARFVYDERGAIWPPDRRLRRERERSRS